MGQYYKPIFVKDNKKTPIAYIDSWDFDNGSKLMEHSYLRNNFVNAIVNLMTENKPFYRGRLIWSGDYADARKGRKHPLYDLATNTKHKYDKKNIDEEYHPENRYIVNHSKRVYIDLEEIRNDNKSHIIHPLPLLTADGNGRGGGDYSGSNMEYVGTWAGDILSVEKTLEKYPKFKKFSVSFVEER